MTKYTQSELDKIWDDLTNGTHDGDWSKEGDYDENILSSPENESFVRKPNSDENAKRSWADMPHTQSQIGKENDAQPKLV